MDGPTPLQALFEPSGHIINRDVAITNIGLLSSINQGFGYGYCYGTRLGVDEFSGYGYDFGVGYGYGFQFVNEQFR